jgi:acyl carrier protein
MAGFTLADFQTIIEECLADATPPTLDEATADATFEELGFDSLIVYEIAVRTKDAFGFDVPNEALDELKTPRDYTAYVDAHLREAA